MTGTDIHKFLNYEDGGELPAEEKGWTQEFEDAVDCIVTDRLLMLMEKLERDGRLIPKEQPPDYIQELLALNVTRRLTRGN